MVIRIKSEGTRIFLPIPTMWVFSGTGLFFLKKLDKDESFKGLKPKHLRSIRRAIRRMRKKHQKWNLVEVDCADGTFVRIKL